MFFIKSNYLNYHNIYLKNDVLQHVIIIYGIDELNNIVYIVDPHIRIDSGTFEQYVGTLELSRLLEGSITFLSFQNNQYDCDKKIICNYIINNINDYTGNASVNRGYLGLNSYFYKLFYDCFQCEPNDLINICVNLNINVKINGIFKFLYYIKNALMELGAYKHENCRVEEFGNDILNYCRKALVFGFKNDKDNLSQVIKKFIEFSKFQYDEMKKLLADTIEFKANGV
jgi:hypothetical protein